MARYILKKTLGAFSDLRYQIINAETGEVIGNITPEYTNMSRAPGIGRSFYDKYKSDIYQPGTDGTVIIRGGIKSTSPTYYDNLYKQESKSNAENLIRIKKRRAANAIGKKLDNTRERLIVKERILNRNIKNKLTRNKKE